MESKLDKFVDAVRSRAFEKLDLLKMKKELTEQFGTDVVCCISINNDIEVYTSIDDNVVKVCLSACAG